MSIVIGGDRYEIPGVRSVSWMDDPRVRQTDFRRSRVHPVQFIVLHTTGAHAVQDVTPGSRAVQNPFAWADANVRAGADRRASWDATMLTDGTLLWHNDPIRFEDYHAGPMNERSLGIEIAQDPNGKIYQAQIDAMVRVLDFLTEKLGVQREIPWKDGAPDRRTMSRFVNGGSDYVGIVGHRNGDTNKSDPGDGIMWALKRVGYEGFDLAANEDKQVWAQRQAALGLVPDGVPGPGTKAAFAAAGYDGGVWVRRGGVGALAVVAGVAVVAGAVWLWKRRAA